MVKEMWHDIVQAIGDRLGKFDMPCPFCGPGRTSHENKIRKVLRVWRETAEKASYFCVRCGAKGFAKTDRFQTTNPQRMPITAASSAPSRNTAQIAGMLWSRSLSLQGSIGERYFIGRNIDPQVLSPSIRFLPAHGKHGPAIIAKFSAGVFVTAIHMTRLSDDGTRKADLASPKIMLGPSIGEPILVVASDESDCIAITEGIEDAASIGQAMGWETYAAGSASRILPAINSLPSAAKIHVAVDNDPEGRKVFRGIDGLQNIIPLKLWRAAPSNPYEPIDANYIATVFGLDLLRDAIAHCVDNYERAESYKRQSDNALMARKFRQIVTNKLDD